MTYRGFHSRRELGMRSPKSRSLNVSPKRGGTAVHWGGPGNAPNNHDKCKERWLSWQKFHMDPEPRGRGWVDIAYNFGFCNHGYVFAGRGYGVRSAAQGTDDGNDRFMAACWIGGEQSTPSPDAYSALTWIISEVRRLGGGREVRQHNYFHSTGCPGPELERFSKLYNNKPVNRPVPPKPTPPKPVPPKPTPPKPNPDPKPPKDEDMPPFLIDVKGFATQAEKKWYYFSPALGAIRWIEEPSELAALKALGLEVKQMDEALVNTYATYTL